MSKIGRNRKGRGYQAKRTGWKPIEATHEVRFQIVRKKRGLTEYVDYKPIVVQKEGAHIEKGPNRKQRRGDAAWERGQLERDRKQKIRDAHEKNKILKMKRIEKRAEENRQRSAKRRELIKNAK